MRIKRKVQYTFLLSLIVFITGCATTVETTMTKEWEQQRVFNEDWDKMLTQMMITDDGDAVTLISPGGVQSIDQTGKVITEQDRDSFFNVWVETNRGVERLTDKVTYIYLPGEHALLEFNYATFAESVSLIDLNKKSVEWVNNDLKWSLERYQTFARALSKGMSLGGQVATDAASSMLMPERFVGNLTKILPELNAFAFKTLDGLELVSLDDGTVLWSNDEFKGGLAKLLYDSESNSLVAVNSDDDAYSLEGLQFNKQIMRIDAASGKTMWSASYDGNIREKLDGFGIWADRTADIRLIDGKIMLNFLNVEVYDMETGDQLWQTSTGSDRILDIMAPEAQIMNLFAFPVIHENILYRVNHENVGLTGVDIVLQAFNFDTGELLWKTDKLSRNKPVSDMLVMDNNLIISMDRSDKILALDRISGEKVWEKSGFGKNGVQFHMVKQNGKILAAGSDNVISLDPDTGGELYTINSSSDGIGAMTDFGVDGEKIYVTGESGFGVYNQTNGTLTSSVTLPTGGLMHFSDANKNVLISPKPAYSDAEYPIDGAYHLIDRSNGVLLGTLGTDSGRKNLKVSPDYSNIYVLKDEVVRMYSPN